MAILAKASGGNYVPAPAGVWGAVCVDVVDLGIMAQEFAGKKKTLHKIKIVWQISELREDGKPHTCSKMYTLSLHEKANLRKDLESWRGRAFTEPELQGFDVEQVLNAPAMVNVVERLKDGAKYANVVGVMRLPKEMSAPTSRDYVRVCDRKSEADTEPAHDGAGPADWDTGITDDDVPF